MYVCMCLSLCVCSSVFLFLSVSVCLSVCLSLSLSLPPLPPPSVFRHNQETLKDSGARVLHLAAYVQNAGIVRDLLDAGADPNLVAKFSVHHRPGHGHTQHHVISPFARADVAHPLEVQVCVCVCEEL